jgi:2-oxoglutarate ferredoxin oxidoreductase subunit alpha
MRAGPSTGIPTKSEQADLNVAIYGMHGDAPHIVVAPQSIPDCLFTTQWAVHLAEALQAPALVLSDQFIGQSVAAIDRPAEAAFVGRRARPSQQNGSYKRYELTASGVSPMAIPGMNGGQYTADGLTHNERGTPTSSDNDHRVQLDKRRSKLEQFDYGSDWLTREGDGELAVITWGSLTGAVREAAAQLRDRGVEVRLIAPRLLSPVQPEPFKAALDGVKHVLVVEQSHGGQFYRFLRAHYDLPAGVRSLNRPGPLPIRPSEIAQAAMQWMH